MYVKGYLNFSHFFLAINSKTKLYALNEKVKIKNRTSTFLICLFVNNITLKSYRESTCPYRSQLAPQIPGNL